MQKKIRSYLGLEDDAKDLLENHNIFVEGECDKKYLEEMCKFFHIKPKKIIAKNGVNKYMRELEFYDDWYSHLDKKPKIILLFDNDDQGRRVYQDILKKNFHNINIDCLFVPDRNGRLPDRNNLQKEQCNIEIEDLIYPEVIFNLCLSILSKRKDIVSFSFEELQTKLDNKNYANDGILAVIDSLLKDKNPQGLGNFKFKNSSLKRSLAELFNVDGNKQLAKILWNSDDNLPKVREFIKNLMQRN